MDNWKNLLYESYVASGQALAGGRDSLPAHALDPYFQQLVSRHLAPDRELAIADVACGHGALLSCLKEAGYRNLQGVDVSAEQVALAHSAGVTEAQCGDMGAFLRGNTGGFDVIFLMDILEHLERPELFEVLPLVRSALKESGRVVIHVPNAEGIFGMGVRYGDLTHETCFTARSMRQLLASTGFEKVECFEDRPVGRGLKGLVRAAMWTVMTWPWRLLLLVETGRGGGPPILSRNLLVVADRTTVRQS